MKWITSSSGYLSLVFLCLLGFLLPLNASASTTVVNGVSYCNGAVNQSGTFSNITVNCGFQPYHIHIDLATANTTFLSTFSGDWVGGTFNSFTANYNEGSTSGTESNGNYIYTPTLGSGNKVNVQLGSVTSSGFTITLAETGTADPVRGVYWATGYATTSITEEDGQSHITDSYIRGLLSAVSPLSYNSTTGAFSISQASTSTSGYLSSTDFNSFANASSSSTSTINNYYSCGFTEDDPCIGEIRYGDWLFMSLCILFCLSFLAWGYITSVFKKK